MNLVLRRRPLLIHRLVDEGRLPIQLACVVHVFRMLLDTEGVNSWLCDFAAVDTVCTD